MYPTRDTPPVMNHKLVGERPMPGVMRRMNRAAKVGVIAGVAIYVLRLTAAFVRLVSDQPQFGGHSDFPVSAIWLDAVGLLPWFAVTTILVTSALYARGRWRAA